MLENMPQATRDIKRRIKSIANTRKVTKAMEMVAAAKMRKTINFVLSSRSYATLAWQLVRNLAAKTEAGYHPLLIRREKPKKIAVVLISSNRGLCGGFNNQIIQRAVNYIKKQQDNYQAEIEIVSLGRKGRDFVLKRGLGLVAEFEKLDVTTEVIQIRPLAKLLIADYIAGKYDRVAVAYTDFVSTLLQKPRVIEILPIISDKQEEDLGQVGKSPISEQRSATNQSSFNYEYKFEPSARQVLQDLLPRLIEMQIYQAILESNASEHSARMVAMRNASDAASEMIDFLTLAFNKARQASITAELADISGGRLAME